MKKYAEITSDGTSYNLGSYVIARISEDTRFVDPCIVFINTVRQKQQFKTIEEAQGYIEKELGLVDRIDELKRNVEGIVR